MQSAISKIIRVFVAVAMGFGSVAAMLGRDCAAATAGTVCGCCEKEDMFPCCRAPEDGRPAQQPAEPAPRDSSAMQPLDLHARAATEIVPPVPIMIFSSVKNARCAACTGHTFQSVRCVRMV